MIYTHEEETSFNISITTYNSVSKDSSFLIVIRMSKRNNLYHPFTSSFLGFFLDRDQTSKDVGTGAVFEDIDLYFQPVPDPVTASIFLVIMIPLVAFGAYITIKVLKRLNKEDSLLRNVTRNFMISQLISWPLAVFLLNTTNFIHSFPHELTQWICPIIWFMMYFSLNLGTVHSFICAIARYFFIVHNERVKSWGKEKAKKLFEVLSIVIPLLITLWKAMDGSELDIFSYLNKCYGIHHRTFLVETSTLNVLKKNFCEIPDYHVMKDYPEVIAAFLKNVICLASTTTIIVMGSNVSEGIIYFLLFSHIGR